MQTVWIKTRNALKAFTIFILVVIILVAFFIVGWFFGGTDSINPGWTIALFLVGTGYFAYLGWREYRWLNYCDEVGPECEPP